jgi:hypothetical protein
LENPIEIWEGEGEGGRIHEWEAWTRAFRAAINAAQLSVCQQGIFVCCIYRKAVPIKASNSASKENNENLLKVSSPHSDDGQSPFDCPQRKEKTDTLTENKEEEI